MHVHHLDAEQRIGDELLGRHRVGAGVAVVGNDRRIDRGRGQQAVALTRQRAILGAEFLELIERSELDLRDRHLPERRLRAMEAGVGQQRVLEVRDGALPDVRIKEKIAGTWQVRRLREVLLLAIEGQRAGRSTRRLDHPPHTLRKHNAGNQPGTGQVDDPAGLGDAAAGRIETEKIGAVARDRGLFAEVGIGDETALDLENTRVMPVFSEPQA